MKFYSVPEDFLLKYKKLADNYTNHDVNCSEKETDFCDCGLMELIRDIKFLEKYIGEIKKT